MFPRSQTLYRTAEWHERETAELFGWFSRATRIRAGFSFPTTSKGSPCERISHTPTSSGSPRCHDGKDAASAAMSGDHACRNRHHPVALRLGNLGRVPAERRSAASGDARGAPRRCHDGRRGGEGPGAAHRLRSPRPGKALRKPHLRADHPVHRPHRLRCRRSATISHT